MLLEIKEVFEKIQLEQQLKKTNLKEKGKYNPYGNYFFLPKPFLNRLNKGNTDTGPTNYYTDSESVLALDGVGFNAAASGISWESAGRTRFG